MLDMTCLKNTERVIYPITSEKNSKETELIKRAKSSGQVDAALLEDASILVADPDSNDVASEAFVQRIVKLKDCKMEPKHNQYQGLKKKREQLQGPALLNVLQLDVFADVCGNTPLSSLNYV